jgi:hypothetical protein
MDESDEHREKADDLMRDSFEPTSNVALERARQPEKLLSQRTSTEEGRQIDESDAQSKNAYSSICASLEPASNVTMESALQLQKQPLESTSTADGTQTDKRNADPENADSPKRDILEPTSNVTIERPSVPRLRRSQPRPKCSMSRGIVTAGSRPKYRTIERFRASTKKCPLISKAELPSPIETSSTFVQWKTPDPIFITSPGMEMDESDQHPEKA